MRALVLAVLVVGCSGAEKAGEGAAVDAGQEADAAEAVEVAADTAADDAREVPPPVDTAKPALDVAPEVAADTAPAPDTAPPVDAGPPPLRCKVGGVTYQACDGTDWSATGVHVDYNCSSGAGPFVCEVAADRAMCWACTCRVVYFGADKGWGSCV